MTAVRVTTVGVVEYDERDEVACAAEVAGYVDGDSDFAAGCSEFGAGAV